MNGVGRFAPLAFALALGGGPASAEELALLELVIDGRATHRVESFLLRDGQTLATRAVWQGLGVRDVEAGGGAGELVALATLSGVQSHLDLERRTLALDLPPDPAALTVIDRGAASNPYPFDQGSGALLNYDLSHLRAGGESQTAGLLAGRWFGASGVLEHQMLVSDTEGARQRRLNTTFTRSDPQRMERLRVGDFVTGGLAWVRPLRLAGVQLATDFALRPGLVTAPTPQLRGHAAVPSTVDVLVNGVRQLSEPVPAGRFEVRQLPVVNGLGEVSVVVRDALGRESAQSLTFYASNQLLAPGLSAYALDVGQIRRGFGSGEDRYGDLAATGTWRRGLSSALTVEAHGEAGAGTVVAGAGVLGTLGSLGLVSGAVAMSRTDGQGGALATLGAERQTPALNLQFGLTATSAGYRDVAATQGDVVLRRSLNVSAGWPVGLHGNLGIAAVEREVDTGVGAGAAVDAGRHLRLVTATYSRTFGAGVQAYVTGFHDSGAAGQSGISVGLTVPLGRHGAASSMLTHDRSGTTLMATAGSAAGATGEVGWRVQSDSALAGEARSRQLLQASYLAPTVRLTAEGERTAGKSALRLTAQGALVTVGGRLHASQSIVESFALVDVDGEPGISVFHQNRFVGRTDANGHLVVPGLLSFEANRLAIDPLELPLDVEPAALAHDVRPADRSGLHVRFALDRQRAAVVLLHDARGLPLPIGARVQRVGEPGASAVVGHEGHAYLRGLDQTTALVVEWGGGHCTGEVSWNDRQLDTGRIGPVRCQ